MPENVYVQVGDEYGLPVWVTVLQEGTPLVIFDRCDLEVCGEDTGVCGQALPMVDNLTEGPDGSVWLVANGRLERREPHSARLLASWALEGGRAHDKQHEHR